MFVFFFLGVLAPSLTLAVPSAKHEAASDFLSREKRAYSVFEEMKGASKERECQEEICNQEEAQEIFQNERKAKLFVKRQQEQCKQHQCYADGTKECVNEWGKRTCICHPGWEGDDCSKNIDECAEHEKAMARDSTLEPMCKNDGECFDQNPTDNKRGYRCRCQPGWQGLHCEQDINECTHGEDGRSPGKNPCKNKAICFNTVGSYSCACSALFKGDNCEEDVDQCAEDPTICQNNGICINTDAGFECACVDGYGGAYCDEPEKECDLKNINGQTPCPHGTICVDKNNAYLCRCPKWGCKNLHNDNVMNLYEKKYGYGHSVSYEYGGNEDYDAGFVDSDQDYKNAYIELDSGN